MRPSYDFSEASRNPYVRDQRMNKVAIGVGVAVLFGLSGFLAWGCSTHEIPGTVTSTRWQQNTLLQHWTQVVVGAWEHETWQKDEVPPVNGQGEQAGWHKKWGTCHQKYHSTERYVCGHDKDGHTEWCSRSVYKTWCDYDTQRWETIQTKKAGGEGAETWWAAVEPGPLDRIRYEAEYTVKLAYSDWGEKGTYDYNPGNTTTWGGRKLLTESEAKAAERAYREWNVGDAAVLGINNFGSVRSVRKGLMRVEES